MSDETKRKAALLAEKLDKAGKTEHASKLRALIDAPIDGLLFALREFFLTLLTAVETIDPATDTLAEELRNEVESRLRRHE